jgi:cysteine-rich repeat protein
MARWGNAAGHTLLLIALGCAAGCHDDEPSCMLSTCGDGGICAPEECDDGNSLPGDGCSPTCTIEATGCQDCVYQGLTSQGMAFEVQVEDGGIKRIYFTADTAVTCSPPAGCPGGAILLCVEMEFISPPVGCAFATSACSDCPSTSCHSVSGSVTYPSAQGALELSLELPQGSGCFVSVEPDPVTWSALCIPGAAPTSCGGALADELDASVAGGRVRVRRYLQAQR